MKLNLQNSSNRYLLFTDAPNGTFSVECVWLNILILLHIVRCNGFLGKNRKIAHIGFIQTECRPLTMPNGFTEKLCGLPE